MASWQIDHARQHNHDVNKRRADYAGDETDCHEAWAAQTTQVGT